MTAIMETTICPECGQLAEIQWRCVLESTDGPVEHAKILCLHRHWFLLPTESLPHVAQPGTDRGTGIRGVTGPAQPHAGSGGCRFHVTQGP